MCHSPHPMSLDFVELLILALVKKINKKGNILAFADNHK